MKFLLKSISVIAFFCLLYGGSIQAQLDDYSYSGGFKPEENAVTNDFRFNGYTNYWHDTFQQWIRYGNLFKMAVPDVNYTIAQSKVDLADDIGIPGLWMQEGFLYGLFREPYSILDQPSLQTLNDALTKGNVLVSTDPTSETGKKLAGKLPSENEWKDKLNSHQYGAKDFTPVNAFYLSNGIRKIYIIFSASPDLRQWVSTLISHAKDVLDQYDLKRGWFGAETLLKSVTCTPGHPLEVIGKGMNEGNSWFTFSGYMDFLAQKELDTWIAKVNLPVVVDVGFGSIYGCKNYDGLQVQSMFTTDSWINFAHEKGGYVFRQVYDTLADPFHYDGYIAGEGNKEQIDRENVPFVTLTGMLEESAIPCMVLFTSKGEAFSKETLWKTLMARQEVAVLGNGKMMGPALYRNTLELLLLDRVYLEEYFGDKINLEASANDSLVTVTLTNYYAHPVSGTLEVVLPPELQASGSLTAPVTLPASASKTIHTGIKILASAMSRTNPVAIHFKWENHEKSTLTMLDLPPAVSLHKLLYSHAPTVNFPVTVHNFTSQPSFPVKVEVTERANPGKIIFSATKTCNAIPGTFQDMSFDLSLPAGNYMVKASALGTENQGQLGVGKATGKCQLYEIDLNSDGVNEYRMENDSVRVTLLATGARVIEYIVKSKNDNVLFKLWPEKASDDRRPFRKRGYYPYGGFEDFLGQGSMETHKVYDAEILKKEGDFVRVRMTADYYGNKLEKTFTLYGDSPLLEIRFALTFKNPEANVLGPQPILELGERHWTEDVFNIPEKDGIHEYRMRPDRFYGRVFFLKEGWNAGYDTKQNISYVGAYPVTQPLFLHMWMNHPVNPDAHYYYAEFQPWTPIYQKSTMYFSYYMWGAGGPWQNGVKALRDMNLITEQ